jgi:hypothetical protein
MGTVRTRISKKSGPIRTTTSWGGGRGTTSSMSYSNGKGIGRTRVTYSTNQKTGRSRFTQSQKVGQNSWYTTSKTTGGFSKRRGRKPKIKSWSELFWTLVILGVIILFVL